MSARESLRKIALKDSSKPKDEQRLEIVQALLEGKVDVSTAARVLNRSVRQIYRLQAKAKESGLYRVVHASRGKTPHNKIDQRIWDQILSLARNRYAEVNYRNLQRILENDHDIVVGRESLRKQLRAAGIGPMRKRRARGIDP